MTPLFSITALIATLDANQLGSTIFMKLYPYFPLWMLIPLPHCTKQVFQATSLHQS